MKVTAWGSFTKDVSSLVKQRIAYTDIPHVISVVCFMIDGMTLCSLSEISVLNTCQEVNVVEHAAPETFPKIFSLMNLNQLRDLFIWTPLMGNQTV